MGNFGYRTGGILWKRVSQGEYTELHRERTLGPLASVRFVAEYPEWALIPTPGKLTGFELESERLRSEEPLPGCVHHWSFHPVAPFLAVPSHPHGVRVYEIAKRGARLLRWFPERPTGIVSVSGVNAVLGLLFGSGQYLLVDVTQAKELRGALGRLGAGPPLSA
jgi:hypothetical protein